MSTRLLEIKAPPKPLPTRGRGKPVIPTEPAIVCSEWAQWWKQAWTATGLPLPLVGRGWGGV
jgi:hypothetical protein